MSIEPGSENSRLIYRALGVAQRLVRKIGNGGTLSRDELRAGELSTQALRACIANPANAHRQELLIVEAERLAPRPPDQPRQDAPAAHHGQRPPRRGPGKRPASAARKPSRGSQGKQVAVTIKKKPKRVVTPEGSDNS